ncbi:MAG: MBL fold metallo-hydrolase [Leptospira sp.]|nr:MBL fold metallo-hydrolase [Leptospira sp.]
MDIEQIYTDSPLRNYTYLLIDWKSKRCISIDPFNSDEVLKYTHANSLELMNIFNTHEHWDHICGNEGLVPHLKGHVCCHPLARSKIPTATSNLELNVKIPFSDGWIQILDTPGHTQSHICLLVGIGEKSEFILTGDTLFNAGVGNCKNGGDPETLYHTISNQFHTLPDSIKVYPGHDYWETNLNFSLNLNPDNHYASQILEEYKSSLKSGKHLVSTIGLERKVNLFFQLNQHQEWKNSKFDKSMTEKEIFISLRKLRDNW